MTTSPQASTSASQELGVLALGRRSMTYALGGVAYKGIALLSVPLIARLLSPAEMGLLDLAAVIAAICGLLAAMGSEQAVAFVDARGHADARIWESALALVVAAAAGIVLAMVLLRTFLATALTGDATNSSLFAVAAVYGGAIALTSVALNAVRLRSTPRAYAIVSFLVVAAELGGAVAVALVVQQPVTWMVLAWAVGCSIVAGAVLIRYLPRLGVPRLSTVRRLVTYGGPLVPAAIAWLVGDAWIRASLAHQGDLVALGEYGIAYRIASVIALAVAGFGVAWHPYLYRSSAGEVVPRASRILPFALLGLAGIAAAMTALAPEVVQLIAGPAYAGAVDAVPALTGGMIAFGCFVLISAVAGASGSTRQVAIAALLGAATQATAAVLIVQGLGVTGAGLASLAGYLVAAAFMLATQHRLLLGRAGMISLAASLVAAGVVAIAAVSLGWPLVARASVVAGCAVGLFVAALGIRKLERRQAVHARG